MMLLLLLLYADVGVCAVDRVTCQHELRSGTEAIRSFVRSLPVRVRQRRSRLSDVKELPSTDADRTGLRRGRRPPTDRPSERGPQSRATGPPSSAAAVRTDGRPAGTRRLPLPPLSVAVQPAPPPPQSRQCS